MPEPHHNKHGVTPTLLFTGLLLSVVMSVVYLLQPAFVSSTNYRTIDVLMNLAHPIPASGSVAIVDIDEKSLARYGQWPWPRSRLALLLRAINASGAVSIGLDLILAEPDRTSPKDLQTGIDRKLGQHMDSTRVPADLLDHDQNLAETLAKGPFVLGYGFLFRHNPKPQEPCELHPPGIVWVNMPEAARDQSLFTAQGVVCNRHLFSAAVTHSGFLNVTPDADGILRRVPMLIRFEDRLYPSLALATLMQYQKSSQIEIRQRKSSGSLDLMVGNRSILVDTQGNMTVQFSRRVDAIPRVSASDLLGEKLSPEKLKNKIVLVGSSAAGLEPTFQTSASTIHTYVDIHAQVLDDLLAGQQVIRTSKFMLWEVLVGLLLAACSGLAVARMKILPSGAVCMTLMAGNWLGMKLIFQTEGYLLSPLFPTVLVVLNYTVLTIFKTWKIQLVAREVANSALILLKSSEENLNSIIKVVPDIIFRLDHAGRIIFISPAIAKFTASPDALIGQPLLPLIKTEYHDAFVKLTNDVFQGGSGNLDLEAEEPEGRHVWLSTHVLPFRNDSGEIVSLLGIAT